MASKEAYQQKLEAQIKEWDARLLKLVLVSLQAL